MSRNLITPFYKERYQMTISWFHNELDFLEDFYSRGRQ